MLVYKSQASKSSFFLYTEYQTEKINLREPILVLKLRLNLKNQNKLLISCCSVAQQCLTLCDPMDCSTPGFLVLHHFLELAQTHVHRVGDAIQPSRPLLSPSPPAFNFSQHQGLFQWVGSSHQVGQSIGASASASILPINIRD